MAETFYPGAAIAPGTQVIASPTQFLFTGSEALRVITYRRSGLDDLVLQGRFRATADGVIKPFSYTLQGGTTDPNGTTFEFPFPEGTLFNIRVGQPLQGVPFNDTFVQVQQIVGLGPTATVLGTLVQGYLSFRSDLGWPGSPLGNVHDGRGAITDVGWTLTTDTLLRARIVGVLGFRMEVLSGLCLVNTSAIVATRSVILQGVIGTDRFFEAACQTALPASSARAVTFGAGQPGRAIDSQAIEWLPFPSGVELTNGMEVQLVLVNFQAGDTITPVGGLTRQWFDD